MKSNENKWLYSKLHYLNWMTYTSFMNELAIFPILIGFCMYFVLSFSVLSIKNIFPRIKNIIMILMFSWEKILLELGSFCFRLYLTESVSTSISAEWIEYFAKYRFENERGR